jgi:hypothetical protein
MDNDGNLRSTDCYVNVPDVLASKEQIDLLVFLHGLFTPQCYDNFDPDPSNKLCKFGLDAQINNPKRPVVLAVPRLFWDSDKTGANVNEKWTAVNFNKFVGPAQAGLPLPSSPQFLPRTLGSLIIAGHSRAYAALTPLPVSSRKARRLRQCRRPRKTPTPPLAN